MTPVFFGPEITAGNSQDLKNRNLDFFLRSYVFQRGRGGVIVLGSTEFKLHVGPCLLTNDQVRLSDLVLSAQKAINQLAYHLFHNETIEANRCDQIQNDLWSHVYSTAHLFRQFLFLNSNCISQKD